MLGMAALSLATETAAAKRVIAGRILMGRHVILDRVPFRRRRLRDDPTLGSTASTASSASASDKAQTASVARATKLMGQAMGDRGLAGASPV
jgi:hypothetical protein